MQKINRLLFHTDPMSFCGLFAEHCQLWLKRLLKPTMIIASTFLLSACMTSTPQNVRIDPTNLEQLSSLQYQPETGSLLSSPQLGQLRGKSLQDTALSLGAQGGLAWSSKKINCRLLKDKWYLETIFNFNGMMLSHGILPPILAEGNNSLNLADPTTIRIADKTYKIIEQARFATTPPNWREYLWMSYPTPEVPHRILLPKNAEESKVWRKAILVGWEKGVQQSYSIFQQNLARLKRDYKGMILYRKLLQQHMVSAPYVSKTELGVTGNGTDMRINDQVLRITELPQLQTDTCDWRAIAVRE